MVMQTVKNPRTKKEETYCEGIVKGFYFNELKKPIDSKYSDVPMTHGIQLVVDDDRISLGLTTQKRADEGVLRVKDADDNYHDLTIGSKVNVEIKDVVKNGKYTNYNSTPGRILMLEPGQPAAPRQQQRSGYQKRDDLPVRLGNAITAASNLASKTKGKVGFDKIVEKAESIISVVDEIQADLKTEYPDMDDYSLGVRLGQCVVIASQHYIKEVEEFKEVVPDMFASVCEAEASLRNPAKEEEQPEEVFNQDSNSSSEGGDEWNDDIPFNTFMKNKEFLI